ncbi:MAG TPA: 2'-deoxycytidine 5'-triphosphate deaminase [Chthonomonadaceae bacterium]|nr:2'-deoxycytidine 5'-triphosphate deaminase [Chthonomonadaceae bacterium]
MTDFDRIGGAAGIMPSQWIVEAVNRGVIQASAPVEAAQIQPNSLDLRLDATAFRVNCSFLPGAEGVAKKLGRFRWYDLPLSEQGAVLERNQVYLIPLAERLALPDGISARANPKSTTGRLDLFTRLVSENGVAFDDIPAGYHGRLYLEVVPRSFAIKVRPGDSLAQVRFQHGSAQFTDDETAALMDSAEIVLSHERRPMRSRDLRIASGMFLTVRLGGEQDVTIGFKARRNTPPIDLRATGAAPVRQYWERLYARTSAPIILEPDEFYIFASRELVRLPPEYCAEMVPFDAGSGEVRTHYAGFFDSGFGYARGLPAGQTAGAVVLEIRNRDVPYLIEEGQPLFRLLMLRTAEVPDRVYGAGANSHYQSQRLRLSKQFRNVDSDQEETPRSQERLAL